MYFCIIKQNKKSFQSESKRKYSDKKIKNNEKGFKVRQIKDNA